jgi:hypothetical protein
MRAMSRSLLSMCVLSLALAICIQFLADRPSEAPPAKETPTAVEAGPAGQEPGG